MDEIAAGKPALATAAHLGEEKPVEQKRMSKDVEDASEGNPNIEPLALSEDSENTPKVRSKLRKISIVLMLCVRLFTLHPL